MWGSKFETASYTPKLLKEITVIKIGAKDFQKISNISSWKY